MPTSSLQENSGPQLAYNLQLGPLPFGNNVGNESPLALTELEYEAIIHIADSLPEFTQEWTRSSDSHTAIALASDGLPYRLREFLERFYTGSARSGTALIRNLPIGMPGPSPADGQTGRRAMLASAVMLMCMSRGGQKPFSYTDEKNGDIPASIVPIPGKEEEQSSGSSQSHFGWHTENGAKGDRRPRYLGLLCLREDPQHLAQTTFASIHDAVDLLSEPAIQELRACQFQMSLSKSFAANAHAVSVPVSVLSGTRAHPVLVYHDTLLCAQTSAGSLALNELRNALNSVSKAIHLTPGDLLLIDNYTTVHGRSPFQPSYDGTDRWLLRAYSTGNWEFVRRHCLPGTRLVVPNALDMAAHDPIPRG